MVRVLFFNWGIDFPLYIRNNTAIGLTLLWLGISGTERIGKKNPDKTPREEGPKKRKISFTISSSLFNTLFRANTWEPGGCFSFLNQDMTRIMLKQRSVRSHKLQRALVIGWYPELVIPSEVFFNSTNLAVWIPNRIDFHFLFYLIFSYKC